LAASTALDNFDEFKVWGRLHKKHAVATWNLEPSQHLLEDRRKQRKARLNNI
jgi:hypothetical protein